MLGRFPAKSGRRADAGPVPVQIWAGTEALLGDLWMWLQLMWLQFEVVRGPVGVVWDRFGAGLEPFGRKNWHKPQLDLRAL